MCLYLTAEPECCPRAAKGGHATVQRATASARDGQGESSLGPSGGEWRGRPLSAGPFLVTGPSAAKVGSQSTVGSR